MRRQIALLAVLVMLVTIAAGCAPATAQPAPVRPTKTPKPTFTPVPVPTDLPLILESPVPGGEAAQPAGEAPAEPTVAPEPTAVPPTATPEAVSFAASQGVNVRRGPGTAYPVIGRLAAGQGGPITGVNPAGNWLQFKYNGQTGWVTADLVTVSGDIAAVQVAQNIPAPPPTPTPQAQVQPQPQQQQPKPQPQPQQPAAAVKTWRIVNRGVTAPQCGVVHFKGQVKYDNDTPRNGVCVYLDYGGPRVIFSTGAAGSGDGNFQFAPCGGTQQCAGHFEIYVVECPKERVPEAGLNMDGKSRPAPADSDIFAFDISNKCDVGQVEGIVFKSKD